VLQKAIALRQEQPARTTPMIVELLQRDPELKLDQALNAHTLTTICGPAARPAAFGAFPRTFRRFERDHPNSLWQGDAWLVRGCLTQPAGKKRRAICSVPG